MGLDRKPKMEKASYISCLTAGSLILLPDNDDLLCSIEVFEFIM
jgi:hypothetical protein